MFIRVAGEPVQGVALRSCTVPRPSMAGGPVAAGSTACHGAHMSHVTAPAFLATNGQVEVLAHAWCADAAGAAGTLAGPIGVGLAVDTTAPAARAGSLAAGNEALQELQHGRVRRGASWGLGAWGGAGWGRLFLLGLFQFAVLCRSVRGGPADAARGWRELAECAVPCVGVAAEVR